MASSETPAVRLSVWRPLRWPRRLLDGEGRPVDACAFYESVYRWDMEQNPIDTVADSVMAARIEKDLLAAFLPEKSPDKRTISRLREGMLLLDEVIATSAPVWMPSDQLCPPHERSRGDSALCLRQNPVLALRSMLGWVSDTFRDVPGACVTLR